MEVLSALEGAITQRDVGAVSAAARRLALGEGRMSPADRGGLLFDAGDWLWQMGAREASLQATTDALIQEAERPTLDPVALCRRLDRLAQRLAADGHHVLAASVWKRAIDLSRPLESETGAAMTWRLGRYLQALEDSQAPQSQRDEVRAELNRRRSPVDDEVVLRERHGMPATPPPVGAPAEAPAASRGPAAPPSPAPARPMSMPELELERKRTPPPVASRQAEAAPAAPEEPVLAAQPPEAYHKVPVHFATHRARAEAGNPYDAFGPDPAPDEAMSFGVAHVTVPVKREPGTVPRQGWIASKFSDPDPAVHMTIRAVDVMPRADLLGRLGGAVGTSQRKEILVFVHGFNNAFTDALMRCAQLAVDLEIDGGALLYSWPSRGSVLGFVGDREQVRHPRYHEDLRKFLVEVVEETGATHIHVVAHSMGTQLLLSTLDEMQKAMPKPLTSVFEQLILAAPDVNLSQFKFVIERVKALAGRTTVYASQADMALSLAGFLSGGERAGLNAASLAGIETLHSIDTTRAPDDFVAHGSFASRAIGDVQGVIWLSLAPELRKRLVQQQSAGGVYWVYHPETELGAFPRALAWVRRFGLARAIAAVSNWLDAERNKLPRHARFADNEALFQELDRLKGGVG